MVTTITNVAKTGIAELREETEKLNVLICDVFFTAPIANNELRRELMRSYTSLSDLIEVLQNFA